MADTRRLQIVIDAENKANAAFKQVSDNLDGVSNRMEVAASASKKVAAAFAVVGAAAIAAAGYAVKLASDFEDGMSDISTLVDTTVESMDEMEQAVLDISKKTPASLDELTGALYQVRSAGIDAGGAMDTLEASVKLATAGLGTTSEAVDLTTSAINAFGIDSKEATEVANAMFLAVKNGKTTVSELAQGFGQIAPLANQMGMSMQDLISITSAMTTSGMSASIAYSQVRGALSNLLKPTKAMASVYNELGLSVSDVNVLVGEQGLTETLRMLAGHVENDTEVLGQMFGSVEGLNAVLMLLNDTGNNADNIMNEMFDSVTALDEAYKKKTDTVKAQWQLLKNNFNTVLIELASKILPKVNNAIKLLTEKFSEMAPKIQKIVTWLKEHKEVLIIVAGAITGALVPAMIAFAINIWTVVLPAVTAMAVALAPFILGGVIIGGIIAGIFYIIKNWETLKENAILIWNSVASFFEEIWIRISDGITKTWDAVIHMLSSVWDSITNGLKTAWNGIKNFFSILWDGIKVIFSFAASFVAGVVIGIFQAMGIDIIAVFTGIKNFIKNTLDGISLAFEVASTAITNTLTSVYEFISRVWEDIKIAIEITAQAIVDVWNATWDAILSFIGPIWDNIKTKVSDGWNSMIDKFKKSSKPLTDAWTNLWKGVGQVLVTVWDGIKNTIKSSINWIIEKVNTVISLINKVTQKGASALGLTAPQIPNIPLLAEGGIVTKPTLAVVGEAGPEAVIPLKQGMAGVGGGNITINITGNEFLGEEGIAERIGNQLMRALKDTIKL